MAVLLPSAPAPAARLQRPAVFWIAVMVVAAISWPNLSDPMIRHDDFPALLGDADAFWNKTLHEGRWINYLWHLRGVITPAWLNFAIYQLCWAVFAAACALTATRNRQSNVVAALMASLILVAPSSGLISSWFNTLMPGVALVALYAVITCRASQRASRLLLPLFTVLTFMAYTTYPLLLLAVCLARTDRRSLPDLVRLVMLFVASFAGAVMITYALNWQVHGVFGVPLADWRDASPAGTLPELLGNLPSLQRTFGEFLHKASIGSKSLLIAHLVMLTGACVLLARRAPLELVYLLAGLLVGLALVALQAAKLGVFVPPRALIFVWVFYAMIVLRGAQTLLRQTGPLAYLGLAVAMNLIATYGAVTNYRYTLFHQWQEHSRATAQALARLPGPAYILGNAMETEVGQSASIQSDWALAYRIQQITGQMPIRCVDHTVECADIDQAAARASGSNSWDIIEQNGKTILILPEPQSD